VLQEVPEELKARTDTLDPGAGQRSDAGERGSRQGVGLKVFNR